MTDPGGVIPGESGCSHLAIDALVASTTPDCSVGHELLGFDYVEAHGFIRNAKITSLAPQPQSPSRTHTDHMRGRVLIVEDDHDLRVVLSILLSTEGWDVAAAATLTEATAQLSDMPDLLVLDVQLGGHQAGELLAQLACRADAPVAVLVSGSEDLRGLAGRYGVAYARKPIEVDALMVTIDAALAQSRRPSVGQLRPTWTSMRPSMTTVA